jgi:hypothetical protein
MDIVVTAMDIARSLTGASPAARPLHLPRLRLQHPPFLLAEVQLLNQAPPASQSSLQLHLLPVLLQLAQSRPMDLAAPLLAIPSAATGFKAVAVPCTDTAVTVQLTAVMDVRVDHV